MTENQFAALRIERNRLLDAWRTSDEKDKMSILVRIEDIDDKLKDSNSPSINRKVHPRRFFRR